MALKEKMTNEEILKLCKAKPNYEEKYIKGVITTHEEILDRLGRKNTFVELQKHANIGDGVEAITVKIYFNQK